MSLQVIKNKTKTFTWYRDTQCSSLRLEFPGICFWQFNSQMSFMTAGHNLFFAKCSSYFKSHTLKQVEALYSIILLTGWQGEKKYT